MTRFDDDAALKADDPSVLASESKPWVLFPMRHTEYQNCRDDAEDLLGRHPERAVETFRDLGLSDDEIARYFNVSPCRIKRLSDGGQQSDRSDSLHDVAKLMRVKLFGGTDG